VTIVGEVADVKQGSPDQEVSEQIYQPLHQRAISYGSFALNLGLEGDTEYIVMRSVLRPEETEKALRNTVSSIDKQLPLGQLQTMEHALYEGESPRRFNTALISALAAVAVLLAMLGIYSIIAFSTALRMQEMALRVALGSPRCGIVRLILISAAKLSIAGCAIGLVGAIAASRLLRSFLFEVSPFDPVVLVLSVIVVLLLALAASMLPAQRAASIDPGEALRWE
jgi:ABC-type antimicrobial peptide transport system permease subunit